MKDPHLLLAAGNCRRMVRNLENLIDQTAIAALEAEIARNTIQLLVLADEHFSFATTHCQNHWRQHISRLYYAAYTAVRSVRLYRDGHYSTESSEHKKVDQVPEEFPNRARYTVSLPTLRENRNLADYDHTASEADLGISVADAQSLLTVSQPA